MPSCVIEWHIFLPVYIFIKEEDFSESRLLSSQSGQFKKFSKTLIDWKKADPLKNALCLWRCKQVIYFRIFLIAFTIWQSCHWSYRIYYTCSKIRFTENIFPQTPALNLIVNLILTLTPTLMHNNVFGLTKWRHFSSKCTDTDPLLFASFGSIVPILHF